jgi:Asp-tRNA(Asn)/Glu-tRNA(Gln) amidotransferase A subunit family amidase
MQTFEWAIEDIVAAHPNLYLEHCMVMAVAHRVAEVVGKAVKAFAEAGAHVEEVRVGITRQQHELRDAWCRLIMPLNVAIFEGFKQQGMDLLKDHRDDFPPQYLAWVEKGYQMTALEFFRDQELRTEVYADADVLAASAAFERLRPWHETYKLCAARPL